jgi:hypothetical protein
MLSAIAFKYKTRSAKRRHNNLTLRGFKSKLPPHLLLIFSSISFGHQHLCEIQLEG